MAVNLSQKRWDLDSACAYASAEMEELDIDAALYDGPFSDSYGMFL